MLGFALGDTVKWRSPDKKWVVGTLTCLDPLRVSNNKEDVHKIMPVQRRTFYFTNVNERMDGKPCVLRGYNHKTGNYHVSAGPRKMGVRPDQLCRFPALPKCDKYLYWDVENVQTSPKSVQNDIQFLHAALKSSLGFFEKGTRNHLRVYYAHKNQPALDALLQLEQAGFEMRPTFVKKKEAADRLITRDMMRDAEQGGTFVLVSQDHDFYTAVRHLRGSGAKAVILRPPVLPHEHVPPDIQSMTSVWNRARANDPSPYVHASVACETKQQSLESKQDHNEECVCCNLCNKILGCTKYSSTQWKKRNQPDYPKCLVCVDQMKDFSNPLFWFNCARCGNRLLKTRFSKTQWKKRNKSEQYPCCDTCVSSVCKIINF